MRARQSATAKAAIEGPTRALAVDYGRGGTRINIVAPGSIAIERSTRFGALPDEYTERPGHPALRRVVFGFGAVAVP
jgi:NAD(P)-dependent dehydrogenase (short-subunit alcohol dehydrogenase family)